MGFSHCTNIWFLDRNLNVGIVNSQWWCTTRGTGCAQALAPVEFCASCNLDQCLHPLLTAALYKMISTNVALVRIGFKLLVCWEFPKQSRVTIKRFCPKELSHQVPAPNSGQTWPLSPAFDECEHKLAVQHACALLKQLLLVTVPVYMLGHVSAFTP